MGLTPPRPSSRVRSYWTTGPGPQLRGRLQIGDGLVVVAGPLAVGDDGVEELGGGDPDVVAGGEVVDLAPERLGGCGGESRFDGEVLEFRVDGQLTPGGRRQRV